MKHTFYHITKRSNLKSIMTKELQPLIGPNSAKINEKQPLVYLFNSLSDAQTALSQWFGELFDENEELVIIEINLELTDPALTAQLDEYHYESTYKKPINITNRYIFDELELGNIINKS